MKTDNEEQNQDNAQTAEGDSVQRVLMQKKFLKVAQSGNDATWVNIDKIIEITFKNGDWAILVDGVMGAEAFTIRQGDQLGIEVRRVAMNLA